MWLLGKYQYLCVLFILLDKKCTADVYSGIHIWYLVSVYGI